MIISKYNRARGVIVLSGARFKVVFAVKFYSVIHVSTTSVQVPRQIKPRAVAGLTTEGDTGEIQYWPLIYRFQSGGYTGRSSLEKQVDCDVSDELPLLAAILKQVLYGTTHPTL